MGFVGVYAAYICHRGRVRGVVRARPEPRASSGLAFLRPGMCSSRGV